VTRRSAGLSRLSFAFERPGLVWGNLPDASGEAYLKDWKLELAADAKPVYIPVTPITPGRLPRVDGSDAEL